MSIPENTRCQEASAQSKGSYIPCGAPAVAIVYHEKDRRSYYMCALCADHNIRNRGGVLSDIAPSPLPVQQSFDEGQLNEAPKSASLDMAKLKEFVALEKRKADLKTEASTINDRLGVLEQELSEQFVETGTQKMTVDGRTVSIKSEIYVSALEGNRESVINALKELMPEFVKENYHDGSLKAYVKDMIESEQRAAEQRGEILEDLTQAIPEVLRKTLKVTEVQKLTSRKVSK